VLVGYPGYNAGDEGATLAPLVSARRWQQIADFSHGTPQITCMSASNEDVEGIVVLTATDQV
jgi:hypothetical protein